MPRLKKSYVVCLSNEGYEASLEPRKLYVALGEPGGEEPGFVRVVDESGEDYLFPQSNFADIEISKEISQVFAASA